MRSTRLLFKTLGASTSTLHVASFTTTNQPTNKRVVRTMHITIQHRHINNNNWTTASTVQCHSHQHQRHRTTATTRPSNRRRQKGVMILDAVPGWIRTTITDWNVIVLMMMMIMIMTTTTIVSGSSATATNSWGAAAAEKQFCVRLQQYQRQRPSSSLQSSLSLRHLLNSQQQQQLSLHCCHCSGRKTVSTASTSRGNSMMTTSASTAQLLRGGGGDDEYCSSSRSSSRTSSNDEASSQQYHLAAPQQQQSSTTLEYNDDVSFNVNDNTSDYNYDNGSSSYGTSRPPPQQQLPLNPYPATAADTGNIIGSLEGIENDDTTTTAMVDPIHETVQERLDQWKQVQIQNTERYQQSIRDDQGRMKLLTSIGKGSRATIFFFLMWRNVHLYEKLTTATTTSRSITMYITAPLMIVLFLSNLMGAVISLMTSRPSHVTKKRLKAILNLDKCVEVIVLLYTLLRLTVFPNRYISREVYISQCFHSIFFLLQCQAFTRVSWDESSAQPMSTYSSTTTTSAPEMVGTTTTGTTAASTTTTSIPPTQPIRSNSINDDYNDNNWWNNNHNVPITDQAASESQF